VPRASPVLDAVLSLHEKTHLGFFSFFIGTSLMVTFGKTIRPSD